MGHGHCVDVLFEFLFEHALVLELDLSYAVSVFAFLLSFLQAWERQRLGSG